MPFKSDPGHGVACRRACQYCLFTVRWVLPYLYTISGILARSVGCSGCSQSFKVVAL